MAMALSIIIGIGLDALCFGASMEDARVYLGTADDIEEDLLGPDPSITWWYTSLGLAAYFSSEDDYRLGTLRTTSP